MDANINFLYQNVINSFIIVKYSRNKRIDSIKHFVKTLAIMTSKKQEYQDYELNPETIYSWECAKCSNTNTELVPNCELCGVERFSTDKAKKMVEKEINDKFSCNMCLKSVQAKDNICVDCEKSFGECESTTKTMESLEGQILNIKCASCKMDNFIENQICVFCDKVLDAAFIPEPDKFEDQMPGFKELLAFDELPGFDAMIEVKVEPVKTQSKKEKKSKKKQVKTETKPTIPKKIPAPIVPKVPKPPQPKPGACKNCKVSLNHDILLRHEPACHKTPHDQLSLTIDSIIKQSCPLCDEKIEADSTYSAHVQNCVKYSQLFLKQSQSFERLSESQYSTILHMHKKSSTLHQINKDLFLERIKKMGKNEDDLVKITNYIMYEVPIIIHVHINKHMKFFAKDTHYRNQFETGHTSGSNNLQMRTGWETRLFEKKYDGAEKSERVKYGTINFTKDVKGVSACKSYGQSYLVVKPHVRSRCTFTDADSCVEHSIVGTLHYCIHVLNQLNDNELKATFDAVEGKSSPSTVISTYKEIQIHGPIEFEKDIQKICVSKKDAAKKEDLDLTKQFCEKNKIQFEMFDD